MELSSKHKYKLMSMLSLCVYYDLYGRNRSSTNDKRKVILGLKITDTEASETMLMTGFKLQTPDIGSDPSANLATTTAP